MLRKEIFTKLLVLVWFTTHKIHAYFANFMCSFFRVQNLKVRFNAVVYLVTMKHRILKEFVEKLGKKIKLCLRNAHVSNPQ